MLPDTPKPVRRRAFVEGAIQALGAGVDSALPNATSKLRISAPLVIALGALSAGFLVGEPLAAGAAIGLALCCLRLRIGPLLLCLCLVAAGAWRAEAAVRDFRLGWEQTRRDFGPPKRCAVSGVVLSSPVWRGTALSYSARLHSLNCDGRSYPSLGKVRLYGGPRFLARGDEFEGIAQLGVTRLFRNQDLSDPFIHRASAGIVLSGSLLTMELTAVGSGIKHTVDGFRTHVRQRIEATFAPLVQGMAKALVLGENDLDEEDATAFKLSGLAHLLAVSGTHLIFAVVSLVSALSFLVVRIPPLAERFRHDRLVAPFGMVLACVYADFAGGSGSAWRAAWMLSAGYALKALNREPRAGQVIAASILVGWVYSPLVAFDLSFMLSIAATAGLMTLGRVLGKRLSWVKGRGLQLAVTGAIATISSLIPCSVVLALLTPNLSLASIVANVLTGPFGEVIALPLCLSHVLLSPIPLLEKGVALVASGALSVVRDAALITAKIAVEWTALQVPLAMPTLGHHLALITALLLAIALRTSNYRRSRALWSLLAGGLLAALAGAELRAQTRGAPTGLLVMSVLDVGQGDATLIDLPDGSVMLIDAGGFVGSPVDPGARVIVPLLRARRRTKLDTVVLSHPHPDHFGGLLSVVKAVEIGEFWDTGQGLKEGAMPAYFELMDALKARNVPILGPAEICERKNLGGAKLDVLAPCPSFTPHRGANDNSWVFRIGYGKRSILLTGDAEHEEESELLLTAPLKLRADVLKVGHHGSRTSTSPAFLAAVSPALATMSCGVRNRYGHPHPNTLSTLTEARVPFFRLDESGGVTITTDGEGLNVETFGGR